MIEPQKQRTRPQIYSMGTLYVVTYWGRVTHIRVGKLTITSHRGTNKLSFIIPHCRKDFWLYFMCINIQKQKIFKFEIEFEIWIWNRHLIP